MPQIGQEPGLSLTISGCIGQVYSTASDSSAMPHIGHGPGLLSRTSGSIGQTYVRLPFPFADGTVAVCAGICAGCAGFIPPSCTNPFAGLGARYFSGSALNFSEQPGLQK